MNMNKSNMWESFHFKDDGKIHICNGCLNIVKEHIKIICPQDEETHTCLCEKCFLEGDN